MSYIRIQNTPVTIGPFEDSTIPCEEMAAVEYPVKDCRTTYEYGNSSAILLSCSKEKECMFKTVGDFLEKHIGKFSRNLSSNVKKNTDIGYNLDFSKKWYDHRSKFFFTVKESLLQPVLDILLFGTRENLNICATIKTTILIKKNGSSLSSLQLKVIPCILYKDTKDNTLVEVIEKLSSSSILVEDILEEYRLVVTHNSVVSSVGSYKTRGEAQAGQQQLRTSVPSSCTVEIGSNKHCDFATCKEFLSSLYN